MQRWELHHERVVVEETFGSLSWDPHGLGDNERLSMAALNERFGAEGWQLVSVTAVGPTTLHLWFQRPLGAGDD